MIAWGWRPTQSCYQASTPGDGQIGAASTVDSATQAAMIQQPSPIPATTDAAASSCPHPVWFYSLAAIAALMGMASRKV